MKLFVLFTQPRTAGSQVPQAIAVFDEYYAYDRGKSPEEIKESTIANFLESDVLNPETDAFDWFTVDLGPKEADIRDALFPTPPVLTGEIATAPAQKIPNPSIKVQVGRRGGVIADDEIVG